MIVVGAVLFPEFSDLGAGPVDPGALNIVLGFGFIFISGFALLPAMIVVAITEAFYIRGALTYAVGGALVGLACYLGLVPFDTATLRFDGSTVLVGHGAGDGAEIEIVGALLQERCGRTRGVQRMLALQIEVHEGTLRVDKAIADNPEKRASRAEEQRSLQLSDREQEIVREAMRMRSDNVLASEESRSLRASLLARAFTGAAPGSPEIPQPSHWSSKFAWRAGSSRARGAFRRYAVTAAYDE